MQIPFQYNKQFIPKYKKTPERDHLISIIQIIYLIKMCLLCVIMQISHFLGKEKTIKILDTKLNTFI